MCFQMDMWKERFIELELPCGKRKAFLTFLFVGGDQKTSKKYKTSPRLVGHKHGQPRAH
jgi:hypothetical protein